MSSCGKDLRRLIAEAPLACLGAYDPISARLAERSGAKALCAGGYAASAAYLGRPDLGLITQTEMADHITRICAATSLPVIADADTGYGGILNTQRTVALWERAGAAGLHIEDQIFPKRCGHMAGKEVIPAADMAGKLRAAQEARTDPSFFIIARTDALAVNGLDDAIDRCRRYADAGADALFIDAPTSVAQLERIGRDLGPLGKPLIFNAARTLKSPILTAVDLNRLGFAVVLYPVEALFAAHHAVSAAYARLLAEGTTEAIAGEMTSFDDFNQFLELPEHFARERRFAGKD